MQTARLKRAFILPFFAFQGALLLHSLWRGVTSGFAPVRLGPNPIVERDIDVFPFVETIPLDTEVGSLLARVTVVPEPGTTALVAAGLLALAARRRIAG